MDIDQESVSDKLLPLSNVSKAMKSVLPEGTILTKDVKKVMHQAAGVFVLYLTTISSEIAHETQGKKKKAVISPEHVMQALEDLEFRNISQGCSVKSKKVE